MASSFIQQLDAEIDVEVERLDRIWREGVFSAFSQIILRTPVDKGFARANWFIGPSNDGAVRQRDVGAERVASRVGGEVYAAANVDFSEIPPLGVSVTLYNNTDYIERLAKDGYSNQEPGTNPGYVDEVVNAINQQLERAFNE